MPFKQDICRFISDDGPYLSDTLDMSVTSNRRRFIDASGKPVDLGSDGFTWTGSTPFAIYRKPYTSFEQDEFGNSNDLTVTGMLTAATTSPSD